MADINVFGNPTYFNNDVTFYGDVTIGGEFNYDNLLVKILSVENSFSVGDDVKISSGIVTATGYSTVGGGSTQYLMANGSVSTKFIGVGVGSTPTSNDVGNNGDIWYTLC
jgi:hypothetical protein